MAVRDDLWCQISFKMLWTAVSQDSRYFSSQTMLIIFSQEHKIMSGFLVHSDFQFQCDIILELTIFPQHLSLCLDHYTRVYFLILRSPWWPSCLGLSIKTILINYPNPQIKLRNFNYIEPPKGRYQDFSYFLPCDDYMHINPFPS